MKENMPLVITVSRQLGSGGAYIGQRLAAHYNALYLDREIINKTAKELDAFEGDLEARDEKLSTIWQSFIKSSSYFDIGGVYIPPVQILPTDREIFQAEADIISGIAAKQSAVIIGRAASYTLRKHPKHVGIFLHGSLESRIERIKEVYGITEKEAKKRIEATDKARSKYIYEFTGMDMCDARNYHLSFDTSILSLEETENIIIAYIRARFGC